MMGNRRDPVRHPIHPEEEPFVDPVLTALALIAALCSAATAVVYASFSLRTMPQLAQLPTPVGMAEMQRINRRIVRGPFIAVFLGAALAAVMILLRTLVSGTNGSLAGGTAALGGVIYLASFLLTIGYHVPRNDRLRAIDPASSSAPELWSRYLLEWVPANTLRAFLAGLGAVALGAGLVLALKPG